MSVPKIRKYSVIVIAGGTMVCTQIRTTRTYSLRTIVENTSMAELLRKLQREVFVLSTREALQQAPKLSEFEVSLRPDGDLEVTMQRAQSLNRMFAALGEHGVTVESMRNKSNRLEELFMNLVEAKQTAEVAAGE